ncbi:ABC transporter permease [Naumannella halotolerans]|uniref:ABC transporter permease n=1 Tax=Naumannella halotolerans TaxID=993414 RepID=UPI00370D1740
MTTPDLSEFHLPGRGRGLLDVFHWRYLLRLLVRKGTQTRYRNSILGWVWSYVKPGAQFAVFYIVMGQFLNLSRTIDNFAVYLFSGIVVINFFTEAFGNATNSIVDNGALVKKIYLPRELFPIAAVLVALTHFLPQFVILMVVCVLMGWIPTVGNLVAIVLALVIVGILALGMGLFFGALNVAYRDASNFVEIILMFATWSAPVLYSWTLVQETVPSWLFTIYQLNPLTMAVELFHKGTWFLTSDRSLPLIPDLWLHSLISLGVALVFLLVGQWVFRRCERQFAQEL